MKIQHVVTKADVGGAQTYVLELAAAQVAEGHEVSVLAGTLGRMADEARGRGIAVEHEPSLRREASLLADFRAVRGLARRLKEAHPDVVHAHSSKAGLLARFAARRYRIPTVYTAHGWPYQAGAPLSQRAMSWIGEFASARTWGEVICLTDAEASSARRAKVVSPRRLHVIPNGLPDIPRAERSDLRRAGTLAPADDPVRIIMVARFAPPKQQRRLLMSLSLIVERPWHMTFVGDGAELQSAIGVASNLGLADRVDFVGDCGDVGVVLAGHDIGVLVSKYEGMPLALLEKMRAGLACVANDLPGVRTLFGDDGGIIVALDEASLAQAIVGLIDDRPRLDRVARAGRRRYEAEFSIDVNQRAVMDAYQSAINATRR